MMNKVLIVTYYWPPSGGVGVQRWLKITRYLHEFGWEPLVITPDNPDFNVTDPGLKNQVHAQVDVLRFPIWEPFGVFRSLSGKKSKDSVRQGLILEKRKRSWFDRLAIWLRANVLIPDPRRFWVKPAASFIGDILEVNDIRLVITTGPPHSMHLIGARLKRRYGVRWFADFRDPWTDWDILHKMRPTSLSMYFHRRLERKVLQEASRVLTVSPRLAQRLGALGQRKVEVITNGIDLTAFPKPSPIKTGGRLVIGYYGLLNELRNPESFWDVLRQLLESGVISPEEIEIRLGGIISERIQARLQEDKVLNSIVSFEGYIPHQDLATRYMSCDLLLLVMNQSDNASWILPMKLFEYMACQRPVFMLGPKASDAADMIEKQKAGYIFEHEDRADLKNFLISALNKKRQNEWSFQGAATSVYDVRRITRELVQLMNK